MYDKILVKGKVILLGSLYDRSRILEYYFYLALYTSMWFYILLLFHIYTQTFKIGTFKIAYKYSLNTLHVLLTYRCTFI